MLTSASTSFGDVGQMAAEREDHVDLGADALDQAADLGEVGRHVEGAVDRADDVDARLLAVLARLAAGGTVLEAVLGPQPVQGAVGALPLILVDGARQEALDVGAFGRHAAADHLGDRAGHDHAGRSGSSVACARLIAPSVPCLAEFFLAEAGDHDRQFVRRQRVGVVQHRGDRQVLAADRAVDDDLQALDRGEDVDRAPVAAGAIVVEDQHQTSSSRSCASWPLRELALVALAELGPVLRHVFPDAGGVAVPTPSKKLVHLVEARLAAERRVDDLRERAGTGRTHQRPRRDQVGEVERRDRQLLRLLHDRRRADGEIRLEFVAAPRDPARARRGNCTSHALAPRAIRDRHPTSGVRGQAVPT